MQNIFKITGVMILAANAVSGVVFGTYDQPLTTGVAISLTFGLANVLIGYCRNDRSPKDN